jgi:DNA repair ATPase RecN
LAKIASGGELSRFALAVQVIQAQHSAVPVLVFDEVDVGISGGTAEIVGQLLRELRPKRANFMYYPSAPSRGKRPSALASTKI